MNKQVNESLGASAVQQDGANASLPDARCLSEERRDALYATTEGPLLGWLLEQALAQGLQPRQLAEKLGVSYGYIAQLRMGQRKIEHISHEFSQACACFLGVPTIVVKLLAGRIRIEDFVVPGSAIARCRRQGLQTLRRDPIMGPLLPANLEELEPEVQDAMLALYQEATGHEIYRVRQLPEMMLYLQRAALIHCENTGRVSPREDVDVEDNNAAALE